MELDFWQIVLVDVVAVVNGVIMLFIVDGIFKWISKKGWLKKIGKKND